MRRLARALRLLVLLLARQPVALELGAEAADLGEKRLVRVANGGRVTITAGQSTTNTGGSISLVTGFGRAKSSGAFSIRTENAGTAGDRKSVV